MGRRSNNGYIGFNSEDSIQGGILDREKSYLIRSLYEREEFAIHGNLLSGSYPDTTAFTYLIRSSSVGSGSTATVGLVSGSIASLTVYAGGSGYGTNVTLSFSGGNGTGADGYVASLAAGVISTVERLGTINNYLITNGGSGYSSAPTVTVSAPVNANGKTGVTAVVSASITGGVVTSLTIHNTGSQYRGLGNYPTFTFSGGGSPTVTAQAIPILEFGRNYTSAPTVTVTGAGTGGIVSASIYGKLPTTASVTAGGSGYNYAPSVIIEGAYLLSTSASATLSGNAVSSISIETGSSTYNTPPTMSVTGLPDLPSISDNQIAMWVAVYNNDSNFNAFTITTNGGGGYTVNWGDGTSNNYNSNVAASKQYTTASYAALTSSIYNTFKPALVTVTLSGSATSFATFNFTTRPTLPTGSYNAGLGTNNIVDIKIAGSQATSCILGTSSTSLLTCGMLERFEYSGSNRITTAFNSMFVNCTNLKELKSLYTVSGSSFNSMFSGCTNLVSIPEIDCTGFGAASVNIGSMFAGCYTIERIVLKNTSKINTLNSSFQNCYNLREIVVDNNLFGSTITDYVSAFNTCLNLSKVPVIDATNVTTFDSTFSGCRNLKNVKILGSTQKVTSTSLQSMFLGCNGLIEIDATVDAKNATSLASMFSGCSSLRKVPKIINTRGVTSISSMFANCVSLRSIPLFDTQNVTTFASAFQGCSSLRTVPRYNTSKVTTFANTFNGCISLIYIPLLDMSANTTLSQTFSSCFSLVRIPALNTTKVTTMANAFNSCVSLKSIPYIDTQNVTDMSSMFSGMSALQEVPLLNTANVTNMSSMFSACISLKYVPLFNTANVTNITTMFNNCTNLEEIPSFDFRKVTTAPGQFIANCSNLKRIGSIDIRNLTDYTNMFINARALVELGPITVSSSGAAVFTTLFSANVSLRRIRLLNVANNISFAGCLLDSNSLNEIYTNLATVGAPGSNAKTITVSNNWGTANDTTSIATNKGWQVTG